MCPPHSLSLLQALSDHPDIPDQIKESFKPHLERSIAAQQTSQQASVVVPTANHSRFAFSIYSMHGKNNKASAHEELLWDTTGQKVHEADVARDKCHTAMGWTWKLYDTCFKRKSLDNKGSEIIVSIHYDQGVANAEWDSGAGQAFLGDGGIFDPAHDDGRRVTNLATYDIDIIAHELTHGVVSFTVPRLDPHLQGIPKTTLPLDATVMPPDLADLQKRAIQVSGDPAQAEMFRNMTPSAMEFLAQTMGFMEAQNLNEHIADCFGIMVKHYHLNQSAQQGSWNIGDGWWTPETMTAKGWDSTTNYQRTFRSPSSEVKQPDQGMKRWDDQILFMGSDAHQFVGIPNHAFYLAATTGFGGNTWDTVGKIWYESLTDPEFNKPANQTFKGWRNLTVKHAGLLFPTIDGAKKMADAWHAVNL